MPHAGRVRFSGHATRRTRAHLCTCHTQDACALLHMPHAGRVQTTTLCDSTYSPPFGKHRFPDLAGACARGGG